MKKYILDLSHKEKKKLGFTYDRELNDYIYEYPVYLYKDKPTITCKVRINENNEVCFSVHNSNGKIYSGYYAREYGKSDILPIIDRNIEKGLKKIGVRQKEN